MEIREGGLGNPGGRGVNLSRKSGWVGGSKNLDIRWGGGCGFFWNNPLERNCAVQFRYVTAVTVGLNRSML